MDWKYLGGKSKFHYLPKKQKYKYYFVLHRLTMESITIKVDESFAKEIEKAMSPYYSTKTEFIREAIRDKIKSQKSEQIAARLRKSFGIAKSNTSDEELREIREKVGKEYLQKYKDFLE